MLAKRIIPCLDCDLSVGEGRVVKGKEFKQIRYAGIPWELAERYYSQGADEIVFLDITASAEKRGTMVEVVKKTADRVFVPITVGGGIRNVEDARAVFNAGADKVSVNTAAIKRPALIKEISRAFGSQACVLAVDAKRRYENGQGKIAVDAKKRYERRAGKTMVETAQRPSEARSGGLSAAKPDSHPPGVTACWFECSIYGGREFTGKDAIAWIKEAEKLGAGEVLLTSMDRDGTKLGFDIELTRRVSEEVGIPVIASGGGGTLESFAEVFAKGKADAALAASIFHYNEFSVGDVKRYLRNKGIEVRL